MYGTTVAEAAGNHLLARYRKSAAVLGAADAVELLTTALVMALPSLADELTAAVETAIASEGRFAAAAEALAGLIQLRAYRTVLGGERFEIIGQLALRAYQQSVWLADTLATLSSRTSTDDCERMLRALSRLRHVILAQVLPDLDADLLLDALARLRGRLARAPLVDGAVLGLLRQCGRLDDSDVHAALAAVVQSTVTGPDLPLGDFLRGLFTMTRHAVTRATGLVAIIDECIRNLSEEQFRRALPGLRLAFTLFTPGEVKDIARQLRTLIGPPADDAVQTASDRIDASVVDRRVADALARFDSNDR
jgi:hypothetical protein